MERLSIMGRTYRANRKGEGLQFDVNFSGADILGCLMGAVGEHSTEIEESNKRYGITDGITDRLPCTRFSMTGEKCARAALKLQILIADDAPLQEVFDQCSFCFEKGSDIEALRTMAQSWAAFLAECEGFTAD